MATIRQEMIGLLSQEELDARDLSQILSIREKEVYEHLDHISRSLAASGKRLVITPYRCLGCGFEFTNRKSFKRPGRCPRCKDGPIRMATYTVTEG